MSTHSDWTTVYRSVMGPERDRFEGQPHVGIQWKGTDVCGDIRCPCGHTEHMDGEFFYHWTCPECQQIYAVGEIVPLLPISHDTAEALGYPTEPRSDESEQSHQPQPPVVEFNRKEYDYLCTWLSRLKDEDATLAFPILRGMREAYHD